MAVTRTPPRTLPEITPSTTPESYLEQLGYQRSPFRKNLTVRRRLSGGPLKGRRVDAEKTMKTVRTDWLTGYYRLAGDEYEWVSIANAPRLELPCPFLAAA